MIKYAKITNEELGTVEVGLGSNTDFYKSIGMVELDVQKSDIDNQWYLAEKCPMKSDEQKEQEEKERIAMLSLTRGDVFRGLLQAKQITRAQIRAMIESNETLSILEKEMALIDFDEALNFYRGNALINVLGQALGITSEQLDKFFETNDYTVLLPPVVEEEISGEQAS
jgi:hypothetical protein